MDEVNVGLDKIKINLGAAETSIEQDYVTGFKVVNIFSMSLRSELFFPQPNSMATGWPLVELMSVTIILADSGPGVEWIRHIMAEDRFWNFWINRVTSGISEGIDRSIKGLKWQAYGYKNMAYFGLKIMQNCGYLNQRFYFMKISN